MSETALRDHLSVKTICQLTGINSHTLRAWERRYGVVQPRRQENGRRTYTIEDLEKLKLIALLLRKGFLISHVANYTLVQLNKLLTEAAQTTAMANPEEQAISRTEELAQQLEQALSTYDLVRLSPLLSQAKIDCSIREYLFRLIIPLLQRVGRGVACEELSVGQEHALSAVVRYHLMQSLFGLSDHHALVHAKEAPKSFAVATMEGNQHEMGALMAAILCAYHGYRVFYLGSNLPAQALAEAVLAVGANCAIVGLPPADIQGPTIESYLTELLEALPPMCEVWIGGRDRLDSYITDRVRALASLPEMDELLARFRRHDY